jgi:hypothetical protein
MKTGDETFTQMTGELDFPMLVVSYGPLALAALAVGLLSALGSFAFLFAGGPAMAVGLLLELGAVGAVGGMRLDRPPLRLVLVLDRSLGVLCGFLDALVERLV